MERVDAVVVGAGVVGLAVARQLALRGLNTLLLERESQWGQGISARSSEVVHAGFYYPPGSLKAQLCVRGAALLGEYAAARGVPLQRCGKFVVATEPGREADLERLLAQGRANGVPGLELLPGAAARAAEPALRCEAALHSRHTGIVDSHALMLALLGDFENAGGQFAGATPLRHARAVAGGFELDLGERELGCALLVNAAGLGAWAVARSLLGLDPAQLPPQHRAKGSYFALAGRAPFSRLIYPLPEPGGLGVHLTLDQGGQARFGPDVEWLAPDAPEDYRANPARAAAFEAEVRRYWPALPPGALQPAYAGIRPKLSGPGEPAADFCIQTAADHGVPGWVNLFGIESPGLTSCLAIAHAIEERL